MATILWILAFLCCLFAFFTFLSTDEPALAMGVLLTLGLLIVGATSANERERSATETGKSGGVLGQIVDEIAELPVGWHILGFAVGAALFGLSIWQYGGISWVAIALVGVTLTFGLLILVGQRRRRQRNHPQ